MTSEVRDNSHSTGYTLAYTYDHNGNRKTKTQNGVTDTYAYDHHDHLLSTHSKTYAYDNNGNCKSVMASGQTTTLTYDYENRVTGIASTRGTLNGVSNSFVTDGSGFFDHRLFDRTTRRTGHNPNAISKTSLARNPFCVHDLETRILIS